MATITVNSAYGLNIQAINFNEIYDANSYNASSTVFRANYDGGADEFRGTGIQYSAAVPKAGTVTSYAAYVGKTVAFSVSGFKIAATDIVKVAKTASTTDDFSLLSKVFSGKDTFQGGNGADTIFTYAGDDVLKGGGGRDTLNGGAGNDKITGGAGGDKLYGKAGNDTFIYTNEKDSYGNAASTRDTIYDFTKGDKIDLSAIDANSKTSKNDAFSFIESKAFTGKNGELRFEKKASDTYIYGDANGDKVADITIHLDDAVAMEKGYFAL